MTDALGYLDTQTEELPSVSEPEERLPEAESSRPPGRAPDLVDDVLGPEAAGRARPKAHILQPIADGLRAAWAVVSQAQVAGIIIFGIGLLILLLLGYIYVFTPLSADRSQHTLLQAITAQPAKSFSLAEGKLPPPGSPVAVIQIPSLHISDVVVEGSTAQDLQEGPGHMPTTPIPGQPGNSVIAGRRATYGAPFGGIGGLARGQIIHVVDGLGSYHYRVVKVTTAEGGRDDVVTSTATNRLTLVTAGSGIYPNGRLAVIALLIGKPFHGSVVPHFHANPAELGLSGDPASGLLAIWWSLVFLGILALAFWLVRQGTQAVVVYLLAVPVLLLVGLFACESFVGFLPATL